MAFIMQGGSWAPGEGISSVIYLILVILLGEELSRTYGEQ